ncbi:Helicase associated domain protein [Kitasatospora sp. LaBMicrA B282]|uniref:helicase associated domain-containing protein n=1 Tax=Kitasatospora sp. LaBMicrA B282 TaxID=3420949 RepID=UPI003D0BCF8C
MDATAPTTPAAHPEQEQLPVVRPGGGVTLRGHQQEALAAIVRALTPEAGRAVPPTGLRATVQMATGSGKSYVAAAAARKLATRGAVLVVVPTLDLLLQMTASWQQAGRAGRMYAVCSLTPGALPYGIAGTTNPLQIALWLARAQRARRPVTLFATYASAGAVAEAYRTPQGLLPGPLAPVELLVCDEAHRTSGSAEKSWTVVHDQQAIPADRRLYLTATPRIWAPPAFRSRRRGMVRPLAPDLVCSMDDAAVYGPQVHTLGLAEAIDRKLLAPFEIVVLELRDPALNPELARRQPVPWGAGAGESADEDRVRPERIAAIQAGLVRACATRGLRRVITFHTRTIEARYFAETLNQTVERLHAEHPGEFPAEVWSEWVCGEHEPGYRASVLRGFAHAQRREGLAHAVLANCRVLGEGVDIPEADGVLLQGHGSMVDIVQAIGRALRTAPHGTKTASLIVPVFLGDGEEPGDLLGSDSYAPLIRILTALRSHSARLVEALAVPQQGEARTKGSSPVAVRAPGEGWQGAADEPAFTLPVRFRTPVDADTLALFVRLRVLTGESAAWREGIEQARSWHAEHGSLDVPYATVVGGTTGTAGRSGEAGVFPLGKWLSDRRGDRAAGTLAEHRVEQLDELGMVWSIPDARFDAGLAWARVWAAEHAGSLAAPARASIGGFAIGQWLAVQRAAAALPPGAEGALDPARRRRLEQLDPWWNPGWPITWQRGYATARLWWLAADGRADWPAVPLETEYEGEQLGRWVATARAQWSELAEEQRDLLAALGIGEDPDLAAARTAAAAKAAGRRSQADRFRQGVAALAEFVRREGHARVPRGHREVLAAAGREEDGAVEVEVEVALGVWLNNTKARRARLAEDQLTALRELGVEW